MPTELGRKYKVDWRGDPPHMLKPDIPVWYRFLDKWGWQLDDLYYDCLLGGPALTPAEEKDPMKRMWRFNLSKRADAITTTKTHIWIIEVSADPGLRAIGQIETYQTLWIRDPKIRKPERLVIVAERIDPDLLDAMAMRSILVYIV